MDTPALESFSPATQAWFARAFTAPTPAQESAWAAISRGEHALVVAPTGSGKTLSAFLWSLDQIMSRPEPDRARRCRVLYVSPLKALAVDIERNLQAPLRGIRAAAEDLGQAPPRIRVGVRTGDTSAAERRRLVTTPPDIMITTPESLFLMLTSRARESLVGVETVIIDEVHAVAGSKRGAHLALSLERLDAISDRPAQRIGLSATVRPIADVGRFLGGDRPVQLVAPPADKKWDLRVVVPVADMADLVAAPAPQPGGVTVPSIWPHLEEQVFELVMAHRSTIAFTNSRRSAERLTARLNEIAAQRAGVALTETDTSWPPALLMGQAGRSDGAPPVIARAHHGSVSKEQRALVEDDLKSGRLRCVVATSSLELGIDMGAVDLVVQVAAPPSVASALQRVGRAGHQVGGTSRAVFLPQHRADLVHTTVTVTRMREGAIEELRVPANPLDVLAQQIIAMTAMDTWDVDELFATVRRAAPYRDLPRSVFEATLDMLAGRYPSDDFADLRPRVVWDRSAHTLTGRPGSQRLAVTSGGTIPDRGLFAVYMVGGGRVGELDEEMVYESRAGDVFALGATSWRIEQITHDRVLVSPAPGRPGRLPFWHGDQAGRPAELGRAIGEFIRAVTGVEPQVAEDTCRAAGLDAYAAENLVRFLLAQRDATGVVPSDQTLVVERFRDELGDWRVVVHSPYGAQVHAPWSLLIGRRLRATYGVDAQVMAADDGIVMRVPDSDREPPGAELIAFDPVEVESAVTSELTSSALFASRFRECASRALLLPRRDPRRRSPLWQQRKRSSQLLQVVSEHPEFPIVLETVRECVQDVYDLAALIGLTTRVDSGAVGIVEVTTETASPFAQSLLMEYVATFLYDGDAPLAERRAAALSLDQGLLAELLGQVELRDLLDGRVIEDVEAELQLLAEPQVRDAEGAADLVRRLGPLTSAEVSARSVADPHGWLDTLASAQRVVRVSVAGREHWAAIEDAARLRDALAVTLPDDIPPAFLAPLSDPLGDLVRRYARTHGPFTTAEVAERFGVGTAVARRALRELHAAGRVLDGEFRPGGSGREWCDPEVLRRIRRRSLAVLRDEVEPVEPTALVRFLPQWQGAADGHGPVPRRGHEGLTSTIEQLAGYIAPFSVWESMILPVRVGDYAPSMLDELTTAGDVLWAGHSPLGRKDALVSFHLADTAPLSLPWRDPADVTGGLHARLVDVLSRGGAYFLRHLVELVEAPSEDVESALWDLVWAGHLTNDTVAPLRALTQPPPRASASRVHRSRVASGLRAGPGTLRSPGRWSLLPTPEADPTRRAHALAERLLTRHGVVTRGAVTAEHTPGGFAAAYRTLAAFEEVGQCRRGYFVAGLGAAQFAAPGAVDRLRAGVRSGRPGAHATVLAATDPANPYGAALPWPSTEATHRPGRKAGALVVSVDGEIALYAERGGRSLLAYTDDPATLKQASAALADTVGRLRQRFTVERANGIPITDGAAVPLRGALEQAGFVLTPQGMRLRSR